MRHLQQFMSKFHLIQVNDAESGTLEEAETLAKASGGKVLLFKSVATYVSKLTGQKSALVEETRRVVFVEPAVRMQPQGRN